jgi:hypothetical protein
MFLASALQVFADDFAAHRPHTSGTRVRLSA